MKQAQHRVGLVLFDGFEVLDVFGPVELFSRLPAEYPISYVASHEGPVRSSQGVEVIATDSFETSPAPDIVMVPGGMGTRELAGNTTFLRELADWAKSAALITSVCTGSALLAAAGLLDGYRATSNKMAFAWASGHGTDVTWIPSAR